MAFSGRGFWGRRCMGGWGRWGKMGEGDGVKEVRNIVRRKIGEREYCRPILECRMQIAGWEYKVSLPPDIVPAMCDVKISFLCDVIDGEA